MCHEPPEIHHPQWLIPVLIITMANSNRHLSTSQMVYPSLCRICIPKATTIHIRHPPTIIHIMHPQVTLLSPASQLSHPFLSKISEGVSWNED